MKLIPTVDVKEETKVIETKVIETMITVKCGKVETKVRALACTNDAEIINGLNGGNTPENAPNYFGATKAVEEWVSGQAEFCELNVMTIWQPSVTNICPRSVARSQGIKGL